MNALKEAEAKLGKARADLRHAEQEIEEAEKEIERALRGEDPKAFKVGVIYNGIEKHFEVRRDEPTLRLLDQARQAFGPLNNPHLLSLFTKAGAELQDDQTIAQAGVKPNDVLLLRPGTVRGG